MLKPILKEISTSANLVCADELAIKDPNRGYIIQVGANVAKPVAELNWRAGYAFFALVGAENVTELDSFRARSIMLQLTQTIALFVITRAEDVGSADSFSGQRLISSVRTTLSSSHLSVSRQVLNASMVKSRLISSLVGTEVWNQLGATGEMPLDMIAARFDFEVTIAGNQECFANFICEDGVTLGNFLLTDLGEEIITNDFQNIEYV